MSESEVIQIVESILPTVEETPNICLKGHSIASKCESEAVIYQTLDGNGFIRSRQHGSVVMAAVPQIKSEFSSGFSYNQAVEAGKQYSSTTIVGAGNDIKQNEMEVTTIHVLGLDESNSGMEVAYDSSFQVPMETLKVPVEAMVMGTQDMQSVRVRDYAALVNPSSGRVQQHEPVMVASTDYEGNCFITVQEDQVNAATSSWNKKKPQLEPITRVIRTRHRPRPTFVRHTRSRMVADEHTSIPVADFKAQLSDSSDTIGKLTLAPSTKKKMKHLSLKRRLFSLPGHKMSSSHHLRLYTRHLVTTKTVEMAFDDMVLKPLGYQPEVDPTKIKRITRRRRYPEAEEYQRKLFQEQMQQTFDDLVAESQKNMEAVFLENTGSLIEEEDQGNLQILVQAAENDSLENEGRSNSTGIKTLARDEECSIVQEHTEQHEDENLTTGDWLGAVQQYIIIVPSDPLDDTITETVISS